MNTSDNNNKRFIDRVQLISIDSKGNIENSDANLFPSWDIGVSIFEAHPFFEIIKSLQEQVTPILNEFSFPCVHLSEEDSAERICDVSITFDLSETHIVIFDYSQAYLELNIISQQRNDSVIKSQELEFSNKLLLEKEKFKNNFIAKINHELATPLTSIKGFIELLEKTDLDYEQEELSRIIKNEASHLQTIFSDMLDISRIELGEFKLNKESFDLLKLLQDIKESYSITTKDKLLDFEVKIDKKINPLVYTDKTRIYQIVTNLLNNSIKYTDEGNITLEVSKISGKNRKQEIEIRVKDTGIGISKEDRDRIFDPFSQINDFMDGSGLGLHVTRSLVHLMDGTIKLKSELEEGTEFIITLRLQNAKSDELNTLEKEYTLIKNKKYRILIVENRLNTQYLIMKQLLRQGCFFVDAVGNAEDALRNVENRNYDLIILDIKLPGLSGLALTKKIRNDYGDSDIKDIPIIGVSGVQTPSILNTAISSGMDSFIAKPFSEVILLKKITRLLALKESV